MTTITTSPRFIIRKISHQDHAALAVILTDPKVMQYSTMGVADDKKITAHIDKCLNSYDKNGWGQWVVIDKISNELVGICGLNALTLDQQDLIHISYRIASAHWRKGYALEATNAVIKYAFEQLGLESVYSIIEPVNQPSVSLSLKAGFTLYGTSTFCNLAVNIYRIESSR